VSRRSARLDGFDSEDIDRKLVSQEAGSMKTTLELPDDLVKEIKLRAVHQGAKLKDMVADLLRAGLRAAPVNGVGKALPVDKASLARRKALTRKFVSGEWGVELSGYEAARKQDRAAGEKRSRVWRG
jgi:hypothetical protein